MQQSKGMINVTCSMLLKRRRELSVGISQRQLLHFSQRQLLHFQEDSATDERIFEDKSEERDGNDKRNKLFAPLNGICQKGARQRCNEAVEYQMDLIATV